MKTSETQKTSDLKENQSAKSQELYQTLQKEVKLHQAELALKKLLFLPVSTLVFFLVVSSYGAYFVVEHRETWYFAFSGSVVTIFSVLYTLLSIRLLSKILFMDYDAPVAKIQRSLAQAKSLAVDNLRLAAWLLPFAPFVGVFATRAIFDFDLTTIVSMDFVAAFGLITIILEIISLVILKAIRLNNINKKWMQWLLTGSGSQVDKALSYLGQIDDSDFEGGLKNTHPQSCAKV
ncbi:hypothetical protein OKW21_006116 [Catalinimonas alkaloidigena]|uniref:hypothetical protein n=1 Tax=Catalinimonas alkaloidigena TaxID=1075417 RepID=UPI002404FA9F|nr:hypothetical protein [Catalinimonas alkaloidigena]MDF9800853.1 hypothetical protein [Catalinimonas alkaloidigena]